MRDLHISDITFLPAGDGQQRDGLLGWVRCVLDGWLRLDGLVVRRKADGSVGLFYPEHIGRTARRYALIWPLQAADRARLEAVVLEQLRVDGVLP